VALETIYETIVGGGADVFLLDTSGATVNPASSGNRKRAVKITLTQATVVDAVIWQLYQSGTVAQLRGAIYADNAGVPGALIALGIDVTQPRQSAGPQPLPLVAPVTLQPGSYWATAHLGTGELYPYNPPGALAGGFRYNDDAWSDGSTDPFGASTAFATNGVALGLGRKREVSVVGGTLNHEWFAQTVGSPVSGGVALYAGRYSLVAPTLITHVAFVCPRYQPGVSVRLAVYARRAEADGYPGALLGQTAELVDPKPGVHVLPLVAPVTAPAGAYYGMLHASGALIFGALRSDVPGVDDVFYASDAYADGPAAVAPFPPTTLLGFPVIALISDDPFRIDSLTPSSSHTSGGIEVAIDGAGFEEGSVVTFGGVIVESTFVSSARILAIAPARSAGQVVVTVRLPPWGDVRQANFTYETAAITSLEPTSAAPTTTLAVHGRWFFEGAVVLVGGVQVPTTRVSSTELMASVPPLEPGTYDVQVMNVAPGYSETLTLPGALQVTAPAEVLSAGPLVLYVVS
jgi:hypothetical protein